MRVGDAADAGVQPNAETPAKSLSILVVEDNEINALLTRAVLSKLPVRTRVPSGLKATLSILSPWPSRVSSGLPAWASHRRAVSSELPVRRRDPSGLNATLLTLS